LEKKYENQNNGSFQGAVATTLTQPLDVLKTRAMNAKPGEFSVSTELQ
jgi:dicarboxylate transporter 10